jgi:hypothetical protein
VQCTCCLPQSTCITALPPLLLPLLISYAHPLAALCCPLLLHAAAPPFLPPPPATPHRVVHGLDIHSAVQLTDAAIDKIRAASVLAPLHNPPGLQGIEAAMQVFRGVPQVRDLVLGVEGM